MRLETYYKVLNSTVDPVSFFNALKTNEEAFMLESADIIDKTGEKSIGCVEPCLKITIKDSRFTIKALNDNGKRYLSGIKDDLGFADIKAEDNKIEGTVKGNEEIIDEESRLKTASVFDIIRTIAFKFKTRVKLNVPVCGMFGAIAYDAIDYFERLPKQDRLQNEVPDIEFYFADRLFVMDHISKKTYLIANGTEGQQYECMHAINHYEEVFKEVRPYELKKIRNCNKVEVSIDDDGFGEIVNKVKKNIYDGDIFQCVVSRSFKVKTEERPLDIYARLKQINPGPYMFYIQDKDKALLGSSPETCLKVSGRIVEIRPIAGTAPRSDDNELDGRYELDMLLDMKELAEHCMLIDLARNDVAKVSKPATRTTTEILRVQKFSHVQHLVSNVRGQLRDDLDAMHAYVATMNMGTLTGAPKIKAMELIRKYEKEKRGFYGGAVCYLTPEGEFDSCIVIRAITMHGKEAVVRAGAGIVYDSIAEKEAEETRKKARACLDALGVEE